MKQLAGQRSVEQLLDRPFHEAPAGKLNRSGR